MSGTLTRPNRHSWVSSQLSCKCALASTCVQVWLTCAVLSMVLVTPGEADVDRFERKGPFVSISYMDLSLGSLLVFSVYMRKYKSPFFLSYRKS